MISLSATRAPPLNGEACVALRFHGQSFLLHQVPRSVVARFPLRVSDRLGGVPRGRSPICATGSQIRKMTAVVTGCMRAALPDDAIQQALALPRLQGSIPLAPPCALTLRRARFPK